MSDTWIRLKPIYRALDNDGHQSVFEICELGSCNKKAEWLDSKSRCFCTSCKGHFIFVDKFLASEMPPELMEPT